MYKDIDNNNNKNIKFTLLKHLEELSTINKEVNELFALWKVIEKELTDRLSQTARFFPHFSKHDVSHSRTLITNISLFLGEKRIKKLSPTDTFLLIFCSYVHDYGMAYDIDEICNILEDKDGRLKDYIENNKHYSKEVAVLYSYYHQNKEKNKDDVTLTLKDLYWAITIVLEDFLRPLHADGVERIAADFNILLRGRIKFRFINAIINICKLHNMAFNNILNELEYCCTGFFSDDCHPRFIAVMIRIGDLLDLDNGRFSREFERTFFKGKNNIPETSKIHYLKHESITHFYINDKKIEVVAKINSRYAGNNSRDVAKEISTWLDNLEEECCNINAKWSEIAQPDFGTPSRVTMKKVFIDSNEYKKELHDLKMELPNDRIFSLLIGSNIYKDKYVAFREVIQNAVDATLLQVWKDVISGDVFSDNKYNDEVLLDCLLSSNTSVRQQIKKETSKNSFINRYKIQVNIIADNNEKCVFVEVIDNGTGIGEEDLVYMSKIGGNHMSNPGVNRLINDMPPWFTPSSAFGIGLQSLFQLTNQIDFYTKKNNKTPRHIIFYSYSFNKGSIECLKCPEGKEDKDCFDKISSHGTMVRFKIDEKLFYNDNNLLNYDEEFDGNNNLFKHIGIEIIKAFKLYLSNISWNYFPVYLKSIPDLLNRGDIQVVYPNYILYSTIRAKNRLMYEFLKKSNHVALAQVYYYNLEKNLFFEFSIPACQIIDINNESYLIKIQLQHDFFKLHYKYSYIDNCQNLFQIYDMRDYPYGEMLKDNKNIMSLTIGIFDKDASKYLSIDRNTLKYNSLSYDVIKKSEERCFSLLCEQLINEKNKKLNENFFPILVLLFTRFVDDKLVLRFIEKYSPSRKCQVLIGNKQIDLDVLRNNLNIQMYINSGDDLKKDTVNEEVYNCFPQNFFCPYKIIGKNNDNNFVNNSGFDLQVKYFCKVRRESEIKCLVEMDNYSKKFEIFNSLTEHNAHSFDIKLLIRCLFKPWSNCEDIVVYKHPISFSDKNHFNNMLEKNIYNYILSPFDDFITDIVYHSLDMSKREFQDNILGKFDKVQQLDKCVDYVSKYGVKKNSINIIRDKYIDFIDEVICYIWDLFNSYRLHE